MTLQLSGTGGVTFPDSSTQQTQGLFTGEIRAMARLTAPIGWLLIDGKTIGSASSGATSRASSDTLALFTELWNFSATSIPIYTSAGVLATRGSSALTDFNNNMRLPLFTPDGGAFLRMWAPGQTRDTGRVVGSVQLDAIQNITGNWGATRSYDGTTTSGPFYSQGSGANPAGSGGTATGVTEILFDASRTVRTATETRTYNLAIPHYIKL